MAPPSFSHLGWQTHVIFNRNYYLGSVINLGLKTETSSGVEIGISGSSNTHPGKVSSFCESKYKIPEYGLCLKEKFTTDDILATEVALENKFLKGAKLVLTTTFAPKTGKKTAILKSAYKSRYIHLNTDVNIDPEGGSTLRSAAVLSLQGWLAGAQASFDTSKNLLRSTFVIGYATHDFALHTRVNNRQEFRGILYQKVNENLETGVQLAWLAGKNTIAFELGCVYTIDEDTSLRAKVDKRCGIGLGITHRLHEAGLGSYYFTLSMVEIF